ncbi:response regulator transcription factor [Fusibacter sp. JL298sf-3]
MYKVLIVDDERLEREALKITLSEIETVGVVYEATDGIEASEMVRSHAIDVVFMDIKMPRLDGLEASRCIKADKPGTVVIILTAYNDFELAQRAVRIHADDYLLKPSRPEKIRRALENAAEALSEKREDPLAAFQRALLKGDVRKTRALLNQLITPEAFAVEAVVKRLLEAVQYYRIDLEAPQMKALKTLADEQMRPTEHLAFIDTVLSAVFSAIIEQKLVRYPNEMDYAVNYIEYHIHQNITLEEVAAYMNISAFYFSKRFKSEVGDTFVHYVAARKIALACLRLAQTDDQINTIAFDFGFNEANYFSKVFKKIIGQTPNDYRQTVQSGKKANKSLLSRYHELSNTRWLI